jgi:hypothetical protein
VTEDTEDKNVEVVVQPSASEETVKPDSTPKEPQKGTAEYNFREARRIMEEQQRKIQELENAVRSVQQPEPKTKDELENVASDDYLTRKQAEVLALRQVQEALLQQEKNQQEDRTRLKFKDYDDVVTEENVKTLTNDDPDLTQTILSSPNPFAAAYKLIKQTAFYEQKSRKRPEEAEKLVKNASKPVSANAVQARPLASANAFASTSKEEQQALYKEMMECARLR